MSDNFHDTELELAGELRSCTINWSDGDDEIKINSALIGRRFQTWYIGLGEYEPRDERVDVDITALLSADQIEALATEIAASLAKGAA